MSYDYRIEKEKLFTEEAQRQFLKVRDKAFKLCEIAGSVSMAKLFLGGDTWTSMAYVDRLVELGDLKEVTPEICRGQDRVFVRGPHDH